MPKERVTVRKVRDILRLVWACGQSRASVSKSCGVSKTTVTDTVRRAVTAKLSWPLPADLDDSALETLLYPPNNSVPASTRPLPEWRVLHDELTTDKDMTLMLLWQEYKERDPKGFQYSQFCELYRRWRKTLDLSMRQEHRAGEKLFVDYCGRTFPIVDAATGEIRDAQVFVAVMGASNYTFAEATWSQALPDWIGSHVRAFAFMGAVPKCVVPDNLKSGVTKTCRYEPDVNPTYAALAEHYQVAVVPARVRRPKDKAKAEVGVQIVQRFILAALRHRTFFSLEDANAAIRERLDLLNKRPFRKLPGTRKSRFEEIDRPAMLSLPELPYQYAEWGKARVHLDYHVEVDHHFYSVPHRLVREQVDVRCTENTVECFFNGKRVASHARSFLKGKPTTCPEHMPRAHLEFAEWTPERFVSWGARIGEATARAIEEVLSRRAFPEHGFRSCMGILSLEKRFGRERLEAACARALRIKGVNYRSIKSILENNLESKPLEPRQEPLSLFHDNIRGTGYYH